MFRHPAHPQWITLTSPQSQADTVRDCIVDGKDIDARQLVDAALARLGRPEKTAENIYYWPTPKQLDRTVILNKSMIVHAPGVPAFSLVVRFGASQFPPKDS